MINLEPLAIWAEYEKGVSYKTTLGIYETVKTNENFYNGKQWIGVSAPDIEKPVINISKQFVDYAVSMLVSDDIGVHVQMPDNLEEQTRKVLEYIVTQSIDDVIEQTKFKFKNRLFLRNCAVDGDALYHWWYNTDKRADQPIVGEIDLEILDSTNVIFGNPTESDVEAQPYIIIVQKLPLDKVKKMAGDNAGEIYSDTEDYNQRETDAKSVGEYVTVLTKLFKDDNKDIWIVVSTNKVILKEPINLHQKRFPIAKMSWRSEKNSYHGISPLTEIRPNQIIINKYYMMVNEFTKKVAFPKILFDMTKIPRWSNKVEAIGVNGDPREAIASTSPVVEFGQSIVNFHQMLFDNTKAALGLFDAALGDARPENTSAIIALQKTAAQPLELQKQEYFRVTEDCVLIIMDIMAAFYGKRFVKFETDEIPEGVIEFDYKDLRDSSIGVNVDVGAAAYWSEITQIQTLDNLYANGIIPDPITYLEQLPHGILPSKNDIIKAIRRFQAEQQQMMQPSGAPQQPVAGPANPAQSMSQPTPLGGSSMGITAKKAQKKVV